MSLVRRHLSLLSFCLVAFACLGIARADSAAAKSSVFSFTNEPSSTQAGGHPNVVTTFALGNRFNQGPMIPCACNDPKDVKIHTPAGVIANPHVVSECTAAELATFNCPPEAQVGFVVLRLFGWGLIPLYRTVPQAGQAALLVFVPPLSFSVPQYTAVNGRTGGDFGLDFSFVGITHLLTPSFIGTVFWGVPGDSNHDLWRFGRGEIEANCSTNPLDAAAADIMPGDCSPKLPAASSLPAEPFVQAPTTCVGPLGSTIETVAYDNETATATAPWPATTGCDKLSFDPSLSAAPTTAETDSASGLAVELRVAQYQDPATPSPSAIRASTVTLPKGFSINPNAADGKVSCSDAQANFGSEEPSSCPEFAKIGTTSLDSSVLPGPINGFIYLGDPKPGDRYRIILTAEGFGTNVKIVGSIRPDPVSGQIVTAFEDLPQAPFQEFDLHFFGSERGILATPEQCGTYPVVSTFVPWAAELSDQVATQFFTLDSGPGGRPCPDRPRPFSPTVRAGTADNTAGAHSPLLFRLEREDGDQNLSALNVATPPGFAATLKGIPYCSEEGITAIRSSGYSGSAESQSSACPAASRVGTAAAAAGAGSRPLNAHGKVYLAGPYKGSPISLLVVVPAVSGPYDLGVVAVRVRIDVDPLSAQVSAISNPLPQILEGVRLRTRVIQIHLDRPGFALNPTNCDPFAVDSRLGGDEGAVLARSTYFQAANCADLKLAPKLTLRLTGGLGRRGHPAIHAVLRTAPGEGNLRRVSVTLPKGELLDNDHIGTVCTRVAFARDACPQGARLGHAEVTSPLLDRSLSGPVYLRSSSNDLPDLALDLEGQFDIEAVARVDSINGRLRATFDNVPDVPLGTVALDFLGGAKGLLQNSESLCGSTKRASVAMAGHNGHGLRRFVKLRTSCSKRQARHRRGQGVER